MHGAEAKARPHFAVMPFPCTIMPRRPAFSGRYGTGRILMRRNIIAALALLLWGVGLTASTVAQQPVKLGVLNDQTGLYADLTGKIGRASCRERQRRAV